MMTRNPLGVARNATKNSQTMYLKGDKMKTLMVIVVFLLFGCATSWTGVCWQNSIYTALAVKEHHPVRIAISNISKGLDHAQSQTFVDGKWQWLKMDGSYVFIGYSDFPDKQPYKYLTLKQILQETVMR